MHIEDEGLYRYSELLDRYGIKLKETIDFVLETEETPVYSAKKLLSSLEFLIHDTVLQLTPEELFEHNYNPLNTLDVRSDEVYYVQVGANLYAVDVTVDFETDELAFYMDHGPENVNAAMGNGPIDLYLPYAEKEDGITTFSNQVSKFFAQDEQDELFKGDYFARADALSALHLGEDYYHQSQVEAHQSAIEGLLVELKKKKEETNEQYAEEAALEDQEFTTLAVNLTEYLETVTFGVSEMAGVTHIILKDLVGEAQITEYDRVLIYDIPESFVFEVDTIIQGEAILLLADDIEDDSVIGSIEYELQADTTLIEASEPNISLENTAASNLAPTDITIDNQTIVESIVTNAQVANFAVVDPDAGDSATYMLLNDAGGRFQVDANTGVFTIADDSLIDYETNTSHTVTVRVTDSGGLTFDKSFTINLSDINEAPTDLTIDNQTIDDNVTNGTHVANVASIDQDSGDAFTYTLIDSAAGRFAINGVTGEVTVADAVNLDGNTWPTHNIIVRTTDSGGLTYDELFTINVNHINNAPDDIVIGNATITENLVSNGFFSTVSGNDPDGDTLTYSLSLDAGGRFAIDANTGDLRITDTNLIDYETAQSHTIIITVNDGAASYNEAFTINVTDTNENPYDITIDTSTFSESVTTGAQIATLTGLDQDIGNTITYSLDNDAGGRFNVDPNTGALTIADDSLIDYESATSHWILVRVNDQDGAARVEWVGLTVTDANDAPHDLTIDNQTILETITNGAHVANVAAQDQDAGASFTSLV